MSRGRWHFFIDRGGTFTDVVARRPGGSLTMAKLLSDNPGAYADAATAGILRCLGIKQTAELAPDMVEAVRMGTTVATNALLERKGDATVLVITKGLEDQLEIGTQARPDIFARRVDKPRPLYGAIVGADERVRADGTVERPLDFEKLAADLAAVRARGFTSAAIVLMHAYAHPEHERRAAQIAQDAGFTQISVSHEVSPLIRIVPRGDTAVLDAYLSPVLRRYVERVSADLEHTELAFMASSGGLKAAANFQGRDAILSGPAGGVIAMVETAKAAGFGKVIGFDMGGTSTDVSHYAGDLERSFETTIAGVRLAQPMLKIHTVAAGGGSILAFDGTRFRAGPQSAGSNPGPRCYRRGGPLTVTDANVMTGKLAAEFFPKIFGPTGCEPLDADAVRAGFAEIAERIGDGRSPEDVADGFIRIAVENMANAIRRISVERGYDVTEYALNSFGSAGGQHACLIADTLGMTTVLIHPLSGLLSAYGMGLAEPRALREATIERPLDEAALSITRSKAGGLAADAARELRSGQNSAPVETIMRVHIRYEGTDTALPVPIGGLLDVRASFEAAHKRLFGFTSPEKALIISAVEVETALAAPAPAHETLSNVAERTIEAPRNARFYSRGEWHEAARLMRDALEPGYVLHGPALVIEPHQTVVVEPGWRLAVSARNDLVLTRTQDQRRERLSTTRDPVLLEVFNNLFMAIAEQMGEALRATAQSVNIKERLDFSCALFDATGELVANAPHLPVHMGSMDRSVESVIAAAGTTMRPGDVYMINAPYNGGTHLPDITVVTPVFDDAGCEVQFYVASRGHHEDVGGLAPGSMTPLATTIEEEGVVIDTFKLVEDGVFRETAVRQLLTSAKYPARKPDKNIADLKAQVAANARGAAEIRQMIAHFGLDVVQAYMGHVKDNGEETVRRLISRLTDGQFRIATDQGTEVCVTITVDHATRSARIDFTGTSAAQPNNFNAPEPVTRAAVLYVFRVMAGETMPLNAGCLRPLDIVIPRGSMLSPAYPAAVVAGNTETSQIVTNALFAALGALGTAQGTMNNLTFGNDQLQYYETICSGAPAGIDANGEGFDGAAAVHVHMTNTRLTDPEILELRYPVVVEEFSIRRGSGGKGKRCSGDGIRRVIRFLEPVDVSILSGFRKLAPPGVLGGEDGQRGRNLRRLADGTLTDLGSSATSRFSSGDAIIIETPTGGGFGKG
jgi:5-oxoprolinase (ATP-hydrolysing)